MSSKQTIKITGADEAVARFAQDAVNVLTGADYNLELQFYLDYRCDQNCRGCYDRDIAKICKGSIPSWDIAHFVRHFKDVENYASKTCITGGEATLRPTDELGYIIQKILSSGSAVELKTNATWVNDTQKAKEMWRMLSGLKVSKALLYKEPDEIEKFVKTIPNLKQLSQEERWSKLTEHFPEVSAFRLAVSVDNIIHQEYSAYDFAKVALHVTNSPELSEKIDLGVVTMTNSYDWFSEKIFGNPDLKCTNIRKNCQRFDFKLNGRPVIGVISNFYNVNSLVKPISSIEELLRRESKDSRPRLILCFHPDRTVSFQYNFKPIGRVSYIADNGKYKSWETLCMEMAVQLTKDFAEARKQQFKKNYCRN